VGAVGCRSFFVAAAEDANYDVVVNPDPKLPPGLSLVSRQAKQPAHAAAILCVFVLTQAAAVARALCSCSRRTTAARAPSTQFVSRRSLCKLTSCCRAPAPCCKSSVAQCASEGRCCRGRRL
jgi:hypothetical protein